MTGNIADFFAPHVARPGTVLYSHFAAGAWRRVTAGELAAQVAGWQATFRREQLEPGDRVALCARNSVAWVAIDLAALGMALVVVPLYVDDSAGNIAWCVGNAEAKMVIVDSARIAKRLRHAGDADLVLPPIVVLRGDADEVAAAGATGADRFLAGARGELEIRDLPRATLATICYTSGTAGRPKGVMLTHDNIIANVRSCSQVGMARATDRFLSILPLSHMFERTGGYYLPMSLGAEVVFARGVSQLAEDFAAQAPTVVFAVPRIFERFRARIEQRLKKSPWRRALFDRCVERGWRFARGEASLADRLLAAVLRALVARPILARLGGRLRLAVVGGAALDPALSKLFIGLGLTVLQGYGMTEASPVISVNRDGDNEPESVGPPLPGVETRLLDTGELLVRGESVMPGYWRDDAATREALDVDGWLHTGDLAEIRHGSIYLRGRAKDILVLSNGEKLPPQDVEFAILHDPVFEQAMLVGEGRPFPVLLAVTQEADEKVLLRRANDQLKAFPRWIRVRRVIATRDPWDIDSGLLTPTLKLKRTLVANRLQARIDAAYASAPVD